MRVMALCVSCMLSTWAYANPRNWKDATVVKIYANTSDNGMAAIPIGTMIAAVPIRTTMIYYTIETEDITYVVGKVFRKRPLNLTLHGKTKIAIEGQDAHLLDDAGKDVKIPILNKIARDVPKP